MANGVNRAIVETAGAFLDAGASGGEIVSIFDTYEAVAAASGTVINLGRSLQGKILVLNAKVYHDALGTGVTLKLGDTEDDDGIIPAAAAATAGTLEIGIDQIGVELDGSNLVLTTGGGEAGGTIKVIVEYVNI